MSTGSVVREVASTGNGGERVGATAPLRRLRLTVGVERWSGREATLYAAGHGLFLSLLRTGDAALAQRIHDAQGRRPFSLSPLCVEPAGGGMARAELICAVWDAALAEALMLGGSKAMDTSLDVAGHPAYLLDYAEIERAEFNQLLAPSVERSPAKAQGVGAHWIRFATPTLFSFGRGLNGQHQYGLLPTPEHVVGSWLRAWSVALPAPHPLVDDAAWLRERVRVVGVRALRTMTVDAGKTPLTGFVGDVALAWCGGTPGGERALRALARFARYCGTGAKTGMGFGQMELLEGGDA